MKTIRQLTLTFIAALFVTTALLWGSASAKATRQTTPPFAFAPTGFDGLFQAPWRGVFGNGFGPKSFAVGDLDGDGDLDIVLTEEETCPGIDAHIFIFRNDGNQNFVRMPDMLETHIAGSSSSVTRKDCSSRVVLDVGRPSNAQQIANLGERSLLALLSFWESQRPHPSQTFATVRGAIREVFSTRLKMRKE